MELEYKNSFVRDLDNIVNRQLNREVENIIQRIKSADEIHHIPRTKHLRNRMRGYKIELRVQTKIYWILCEVFGNKMILVQVKSEKWCKKNL